MTLFRGAERLLHVAVNTIYIPQFQGPRPIMDTPQNVQSNLVELCQDFARATSIAFNNSKIMVQPDLQIVAGPEGLIRFDQTLGINLAYFLGDINPQNITIEDFTSLLSRFHNIIVNRISSETSQENRSCSIVVPGTIPFYITPTVRTWRWFRRELMPHIPIFNVAPVIRFDYAGEPLPPHYIIKQGVTQRDFDVTGPTEDLRPKLSFGVDPFYKGKKKFGRPFFDPKLPLSKALTYKNLVPDQIGSPLFRAPIASRQQLMISLAICADWAGDKLSEIQNPPQVPLGIVIGAGVPLTGESLVVPNGTVIVCDIDNYSLRTLKRRGSEQRYDEIHPKILESRHSLLSPWRPEILIKTCELDVPLNPELSRPV